MIWLAQLFLAALLSVAFGTSQLSAAPLANIEVSPNAEAQGGEILVTGQVTSAEDGAPLADVAVVLIDATASIDFVEEARTDASGRYTVTETIFNSWRIRFVPTNNDYLLEYYDDTYLPELSTVFTTTPGLVLNGLDAALSTRGESQLTGRVTAYHDGRPLRDIYVNVYDESGKWLQGPFVTDDNGAYTVTELALGGIKLYYDASHSGTNFASEYYNDKLTLAQADIIDVNSAQVQDVNAWLNMAGGISGLVTSSWEGVPVRYFAVTVYDGNGTPIRHVSGWNGRYGIDNLLPGAYKLHFRDVDNHHSEEYYDNAQSLEAASPVNVVISQITDEVNVELTLVSPVTPKVVSIATATGAENTIIFAYAHDPAPYFSIDGGLHWQQVATVPWDKGLDDPFNPTLYVNAEVGLAAPEGSNGTSRLLYSDGEDVYVSSDLGQSWAQDNLPECSGFGYVEGFVSDPLNSANIYLAQECADYGGFGWFYKRYQWFSSNAGETWEELTFTGEWPQLHVASPQIVPSPVVAGRLYFNGGAGWHYRSATGEAWVERDFPVNTVVPDAQNADLLYGWSQSALPSLVGMRSENGGANWTEWAAQPCPSPIRLLAHPTKTEKLIVRCHEGLFGSEDGGDSWKLLNSNSGQRLAPDYGTAGRILMVMHNGRLAGSTNDGESWQVLQAPMLLYLPSLNNR